MSSPYLRVSCGERGPPLLDRGQPQRVGVQIVGVPGQLARHVAEQDGDLADPVGERRRAPGRGSVRPPAPGAAPATSVVASTPSGSSGLPASARVREWSRRTRAPRRGPAVRPRRRVRRPRPACGSAAAISLEAEAQHVGLLRALAGAGGQLVQFGGDGRAAAGRPRRTRRAARRPRRPRTGRAPAAAGRACSSPCWSVWPCTATRSSASSASSPTGTDRPPTWARERPSAETVRLIEQRARPRARRPPPRRGARRARPAGTTDPPLDHGRLGADPHQRGVRPPAEQQPEAGDDHGLARTGLTGHRGEAGRQLDDRVVDDPERPYPHLLQHGHDHTRSTTPVCDGPHPSDHGVPWARPSRQLRARAGSRTSRPRQCGAPRQPATGSANLATSRSVNEAWCSRASRTGTAPRRTSTRAPGGQFDGPPPVAPQHPVRGVRLHLHREHRVRRGHQRLGEQRVRADRHHQQRLHLGPHHRPAGREGVGGRTGRRRADDRRRSRSR